MAAPVSAATVSPCPCPVRVRRHVHGFSVSHPRPRSRHFPCDFPATRLRHFTRESLIARVFRRSEHRQGGTRGRQGESYLDDAQRATQSKGDSRGARGEPGADADWTRIVRGHGLDADIRGLATGTGTDWTRTWTVLGLDAVTDWTRPRPSCRPVARIFRGQTATTSRTHKA
jgi:hypothetical protein